MDDGWRYYDPGAEPLESDVMAEHDITNAMMRDRQVRDLVARIVNHPGVESEQALRAHLHLRWPERYPPLDRDVSSPVREEASQGGGGRRPTNGDEAGDQRAWNALLRSQGLGTSAGMVPGEMAAGGSDEVGDIEAGYWAAIDYGAGYGRRLPQERRERGPTRRPRVSADGSPPRFQSGKAVDDFIAMFYAKHGWDYETGDLEEPPRRGRPSVDERRRIDDRAVLFYELTRRGLPQGFLAEVYELSPQRVSDAVRRGERLAGERRAAEYRTRTSSNAGSIPAAST